MQMQLVFSPAAEVDADALVVFIPEQETRIQGGLATLDKSLGGLLSEITGGEFTGRAFETQLLFKPSGLRARRLLLVGTGKTGKLGVLEMRRLAGAAARQLKAKGLRTIAFFPPPELAPSNALKAIITGVHGANFDPGKYRSDRKPDAPQIETVTLILESNMEAQRERLELAMRMGEAIGAAQNFARELINEPSNQLTPTVLARRAQEMARECGLECELIDEKRARELKMGAFLSVARGSAEPPVMIVLRYNGAPNGTGPVLAFVGKGITFDTGGISIKPADGMEKMKYDMAGGATMLGTMRALAQLKPRLNLIAIIPATENMPGGRAQKPGDVQRSMSGKTIEVLNTDAEGRMVLADGLTYARQLGATHLIDAATLTGAVSVALGTVHVGVFANDDNFFQQFAKATETAGEKMWRLPLDDEYFEQIRGTVGDILNTGGRYGGAITAAMFLKEFVDETPWIHLDIAGTGWLDSDKAWLAKGPSAVALPSLVELALAMADAQK